MVWPGPDSRKAFARLTVLHPFFLNTAYGHQELFWQQQECGIDANTHGAMRLFVSGIFEIPVKNQFEHAADLPVTS